MLRLLPISPHPALLPGVRRCGRCVPPDRPGGAGGRTRLVGEEDPADHGTAPGSDRLQSWLVPPVQAALTGYGFHVTNPEAVMQGEKPVLEEVGPFVYKAVTVKDSVDQDTRKEHLEYNEDGETLTYRPR